MLNDTMTPTRAGPSNTADVSGSADELDVPLLLPELLEGADAVGPVAGLPPIKTTRTAVYLFRY